MTGHYNHISKHLKKRNEAHELEMWFCNYTSESPNSRALRAAFQKKYKVGILVTALVD